MDILQTDITYIPGIGPRKASTLNKEIDAFTLGDILRYYPYRYIDRTRMYYVHEIDNSSVYIQLKGKIASFEIFGEGRKQRLVGHFTDGTGFLDLVWFQGIRHVETSLKVGQEYIVFGKPARFGNKYSIAHPDIDPYNGEADRPTGFMAMYNTTERMKNSYLNSKAIQKIIESALKMIKTPIAETLSPDVIKAANLIPYNDAIRNIHFPETPILLRDAEYRLKFEELFLIQLSIVRYASDRKAKLNGFFFNSVGDYLNGFYANPPNRCSKKSDTRN